MKRFLITLAVSVLLIVPQFAAGDDVADLKAASQKMIQALTSLNAEALASMVYPGAVVYGSDAAFPNVMPMENTQAFVTQILKSWFNNLESLQISLYNPQYRVVGNMGLVWGHETANFKVKGEPVVTEHSRVTRTWIKSDGKWYVIMGHVSAIPSGN